MVKTEYHDIVVIGGGPAGMAAALGAKRAGIDDVLLLERDTVLGGVLNQCIHDGFGLFLYKETLTGPEYAETMIQNVQDEDIQIESPAMVLDLSSERRLSFNTPNGYRIVDAGAVVLAMGCRERTREMLEIPGSRPAGIFTAGSAQNLVNLRNLRIGRNAVILGSGDIGLIMARRLTLEGMNVLGVYEKMPYCNGLKRNVRHCLKDYGIPLHLSSTVVDIFGTNRVEGVLVGKVDPDGNIITGTEEKISCDTLILSVGLIPENELSKKAGIEIDPLTSGAVVDQSGMTSIPGIFACGNVLHIHDIADMASVEGFSIGEAAARYLRSQKDFQNRIYYSLSAGPGVRYCLPQKISEDTPEQEITLRASRPGREQHLEIIGVRTGTVYGKQMLKNVLPSEEIRISVSLGGMQEDLKVMIHD